MEINSKYPIGPSSGKQVSDQASSDRHSWLVFLVGATIAIIGDNSSESRCGSPLKGIKHNKQLNQALVDWGANGLNNKNVSLTNILQDANEDVLIAEFEDLGSTQGHA